jgi:hypothetical protein
VNISLTPDLIINVSLVSPNRSSFVMIYPLKAQPSNYATCTGNSLIHVFSSIRAINMRKKPAKRPGQPRFRNDNPLTVVLCSLSNIRTVSIYLNQFPPETKSRRSADCCPSGILSQRLEKADSHLLSPCKINSKK